MNADDNNYNILEDTISQNHPFDNLDNSTSGKSTKPVSFQEKKDSTFSQNSNHNNSNVHLPNNTLM